LGWSPKVKFDEGFEKTVDWYLSHEEWLDHVTSGAYVEYYKKMYENR
jgi:dTDP-glucose 4,6-dehydratase